ncbi:MAG: type III polyketide synthase [bacterium]
MPSKSTERRSALFSIGTSVPENAYSQEQALQFMKAVPGYDSNDKAFLDRIYPGSAIDTRHSVISDWNRETRDFSFFSRTPDMMPEPGLKRRNELFAEESANIAEKAAREALEYLPAADLEGITHIITVSCTGFTAPGLDYQLIRRLGLRSDINRFHVGFMGCFAFYPALKMADSFVKSDPDSRVLVVCVELCSLHFQFKSDREQMVANSLFSDGAAACIVGATESTSDPGGGYLIDGFASALLDDSAQDMAWTIGDVAFDMRLSAYVPKIVQKNIGSIVERLTGDAGKTAADIDAWAIHPGGRAVLDRVIRGLALDEATLWASFDVLRKYGNMSSPTILFVLKRLLEDATRGVTPGDQVLSAAFGPGLTVESAFLTAR